MLIERKARKRGRKFDFSSLWCSLAFLCGKDERKVWGVRCVLKAENDIMSGHIVRKEKQDLQRQHLACNKVIIHFELFCGGPPLLHGTEHMHNAVACSSNNVSTAPAESHARL